MATGPAAAAEEGLITIHELVRVGNKICTRDHFHSGSSYGQPSRQAAIAAAGRDWSGFTAWEYGAQWGSFALSETKRISCNQASGWSCTVDARPCRATGPARRRR